MSKSDSHQTTALIKWTLNVSLGVQFIIGVIDWIALQWKIRPEGKLYRTLLWIEFSVQCMEFLIYVALAYLFTKTPSFLKNVTLVRYVDWFFTTPTMLVTWIGFLSGATDFSSFWKKHRWDILIVILLDFVMLGMGWISEWSHRKRHHGDIITECYGDIQQKWVTAGFLPFLLLFGYVYHRFYQDIHQNPEKRFIFMWFTVLWALYGIAAYGSYSLRNSAYNILDIFSKNITGLLLAWKLWQFRQG